MKLTFPCFKCIADPVKPDKRVYQLPLNDSDIYKFTCEAGHACVFRLQDHRCELLFELAICALADGYYREAVVTATGALERFYELFIRVVWLKTGRDEASIRECWKNLSLSERQLGLFIGTYLAEFNESPRMLSRKSTEFRNDVVHKGALPSRKEAINYLNEILDFVNFTTLKMHSQMWEFILKYQFERAHQLDQRYGTPILANAAISSTLLVTRSSPRISSIDAKLALLEFQRPPLPDGVIAVPVM